MLSQDYFRSTPRRLAGLDFYGGPVAPVAEETPPPETSVDRELAIKTAIALARKAGLSDHATADALQKAGATADEIKAFIQVHLETVTATTSTTSTTPQGDPLTPPPKPASSISPGMIAGGLFLAWLAFK